MKKKTLDLYLLSFRIGTKCIIWFGKYELLNHFDIKFLINFDLEAMGKDSEYC